MEETPNISQTSRSHRPADGNRLTAFNHKPVPQENLCIFLHLMAKEVSFSSELSCKASISEREEISAIGTEGRETVFVRYRFALLPNLGSGNSLAESYDRESAEPPTCRGYQAG
ncbi:hypothetical protein TIFTF001_034083 [Ficus carica]|uniref:Uncharacterized protein n=1 Tax=Ficus carica TaxID=3494 RepID=A0AA88DZ77_FICCA|nr:hypothetical protein TIFTF001_034083 [Ficus carica]